MIRKIDVVEPPNHAGAGESGKDFKELADGLSVTYRDADPTLCFRDFNISTGLVLSVSDRPPSPKSQTVIETENASISLGFNLHHHIRSTLYSGRRAEIFERCPGSYAFCYLPGTRCIVEMFSKKRVSGVSVHFSVNTFKELFSESPKYLNEIFSGPKNRPRFYREARINCEISNILNQIITCPYDGPIRRVYLEAKALELVALAMADMDKRIAPSTLCRQDEEKVREAYHILSRQIEAPPSLCELSKKIGINRNKLNDGFKRLYGNTVFSVLRDLRLYQARDLLLDSENSLADIALSVGYSDQANFTTAFRRQFGKTPLTFRREGKMPDS